VSHQRPTPVDLSDPEGRAEVRRRYEEVVARRIARFGPNFQDRTLIHFWELDLWQNMWWLGIPVLKTPSDMWMMQQLIAEVRPDFIIEAGTSHGGSSLYFANVLEGLGLDHAKVITIDVERMISEASKHPFWQKHVEFILGSSVDPEVVSKIRERVKGGTVMVVLDSNHAQHHVAQELEAYGPLVTPGSYIVAEDTALDGIPLAPDWAGPMSAVKEFLQSETGAYFEPDTAREAYLVTFHPGGWLRRTR
jgi:cephalosporin hydroxylase